MALQLAHAGDLAGGRSDLPIPEQLFGLAAAGVLVVSFIGLAVLWPKPKLEDGGFKALPRVISRVLLSGPVAVLCGAVGVFLLGLVVWSGLTGVQVSSANFAPTFVYVIFWLGLVPVSLVFGDVFRAFNPWRAIGRAVAWVAQTAAREPLPAPLTYPERLGHWPAAAGILAFGVLEVVAAGGSEPQTVAVATLVYSAATFVAMALYGVEPWCERGEAFGVYFGLFAHISPFTRRGDELGLRRPLSGLAGLSAVPGTVALLAVMIGTVTFDGASEGPLWTGLVPGINDFFASLGLSAQLALEATFLVGLLGAITLVYGFYRLGVAGARSVGGPFSAARLAKAFVPSLVPIALAYVAAHYMTFLLFQGQAIAYLASNPLGQDGVDILGTAGNAIDYGLLGAETVWYCQVALVVVGHVAALTLAHEKALVVYDEPGVAVRSQYWMLTVMVGFTCLALLLLSQSNT
jgi:hypothetical protein